MTTNILVCDDERDAIDRITAALGAGVHVKELVGDVLAKEIDAFFDGVSKLLSGEDPVQDIVSGTAFNGIDVAIVDNNLSGLKRSSERLTAEGMIEYLRAFTDIPYIVSLNKNPDIDFDLRYMVGDYQTHADLALNTDHLSSGSLWQNRPKVSDIGEDVLAPSYWPNLHEVADSRRELMSTVEHGLDEPVLDVLDFSSSSLEMLSRHAKGALSPKATTDDDLRKVTCVGFFRDSCRSLLPKERKALAASVNAGSLWAKKAVARTVAANLEKWVVRDALMPQDVLVDLPHLLTRMPFLLEKDAGDLQKWNSVLCRVGTAKDALEILADAFTRERIEKARFRTQGIYMRWPCFWWRQLREDEELNERFFSCQDPWADVVFCEDVSQFYDLASTDRTGADGPREFEAEFGGAWSRRYIKSLPNVQYAPRSRLAM